MAAPPGKKSQRGGATRALRSAVRHVTEAAIAYREGLPVVIRARHGSAVSLAVETLTNETLADVKKGGVLVLTHQRAKTLKIRLYTPDVVAVPLVPEINIERLLAIADPTFDLAEPMKGPFLALRDALPQSYGASVKLAKLAGLLPATIVAPLAKRWAHDLAILADEISAYEKQTIDTLTLVTRARVPLAGAEQTELAAFRAKDGGPEHYAIVINAPTPHDPVLVRLHSECFTGDLLGSLKCDCGPQLRGAVDAISKEGGGILLYLAQEGRGIGLVNKLRAYKLQDQGFDTLEANQRLGFEIDERLYGIAAKMLTLLGYHRVRLMTNNPAKVKALQSSGIDVVKRVPHHFPENSHNRDYLRAKAAAGHLL